MCHKEPVPVNCQTKPEPVGTSEESFQNSNFALGFLNYNKKDSLTKFSSNIARALDFIRNIKKCCNLAVKFLGATSIFSRKFY
jgi:hypothetical protein